MSVRVLAVVIGSLPAAGAVIGVLMLSWLIALTPLLPVLGAGFGLLTATSWIALWWATPGWTERAIGEGGGA